MRTPFLILFLLICATSVTGAQTEIYKCRSADGGVMYSQLPCKDEVPAEAEEPVEAEKPEAIEEPVPTTDISPDYSASSEETASCKKRYRDEIDVVDAELRRETSREKDDDYKQRLLALTQKLRAC